MRTVILTGSGKYLDYLNPHKHEFRIEDIARGLSHTCRFTGQCKQFYSVAQHSVLVSLHVPKCFALQALLHDAAEAYICDMPTPLKQLIPDYSEIEKRVLGAIYNQFGFNSRIPAIVKEVDRQLLLDEQKHIMGNTDDWGLIDEPLGIKIIPWLPLTAYMTFMTRYGQLT